MPGDLLDLILLVLVAAFAVAGYRQGFIIGVLSFAGFIGGGAVGALVGPTIARAVVSGAAAQAAVAICTVFLAAVIGQVIASGIGIAVRSRVTWHPAAVVDSLGGAVVSILSVLLIAWVIGSAVAYSPFPVISRQVNNSLVLRAVDGLMPPAATVMFSNFRSLLDSGPYAPVFSALGAEGALSVPPPSTSVLSSRELSRVERSIVKIVGVAPSCSRRIEGSGFVYAPGRVLTNAHVVAGESQGTDVYSSRNVRFAARVVLYDPLRDLAVLDVPGLRAPPLRFAGAAKAGADAIVAGYPLNNPFTAVAARIGGEERAESPDIYQTAQVTRQIYAIRAVVRPGNSGGPLLAPSGRVYGVVFAAATSVPDTGYALTASEVARDAAAGARALASVSTQGCDG